MALKKFNEHSSETVKGKKINEGSTSAFDYSVLADFCKVRNKSMAGSPTDEPTPRLKFIISLLEKHGIEYELDIWSKERTYTSYSYGSFGNSGGMNSLYGSMYGNSNYYGSSIWGDDDDDDPQEELTLADFFGFEEDEVDTVFAQHPLQHHNKPLWEEEKSLTKKAFEWWDKSIDDLKKMLQAAEKNGESKTKKRILNNLIKYKKLVVKQFGIQPHSPRTSYSTLPASQRSNGSARKSETKTTKSYYFNLYLKGGSDKMIMAHHDVANTAIDNCNDNSASVINAISCKLLMPELNVAITDGEENGGHGAQRTADRIKEGYFGEIDFVLNFELTAVGGTDFFVERYTSSPLFKRIAKIFPNLETYNTPFHDGIILRKNNIDSVVINPLPRLKTGALDYSLLHYCHSARDTISLANYDDMQDFCEKVVTSIIRNTPAPHIDYERIEEETKTKAIESANMIFENWYRAPNLEDVNLLTYHIMNERMINFKKGEVTEDEFENFIKYINFNLKPKRYSYGNYSWGKKKTEEEIAQEELEERQKAKPAVTAVRKLLDNNPHLYETKTFESLVANTTYQILFDFEILKLEDYVEDED
jgi:hypothetical protein